MGWMSKMDRIYKEDYPIEKIKIVISAIRRIPGWVLFDIFQRGLWDDLFLSMLSVLCENIEDKKSLYNASQRRIYWFLKGNGFRKVRKLNTSTGKINGLWVKD